MSGGTKPKNNQMAACHANDGDSRSNKDDNLENIICRHLEDLEKVIEDITISVIQLESSYTPQELGKTEEELRCRDIQLFYMWQELRSIESLLKTKDKPLQEIYEDIRRLNSEIIGHERPERSSEQELKQEIIEKTKKQMETDVKIGDTTDWEPELSAREELNRCRIRELEEIRLKRQRNQMLHITKNRKEKLKNRADVINRRLELLTETSFSVKRSIHKERLAIGWELILSRGKFRTGEVGPQEEEAVGTAAATQVGGYEREEEEDTGPVEDRKYLSPEK